ncbi:MAG: O-methyltransferase [Solirubrobacterales bacterium]
MTEQGQVGDGREAALADYVERHARAGDLAHVIATVDEYCYRRSIMMNIGDEKGEILDRAVVRAAPRRALELGTYCGYSALRIVQMMPADGHLWTIELLQDNADIAKRIWKHAGISERVTVLTGTFSDGETIERLQREHGFAEESVDFVFLDHHKDHYVEDLQHIVSRGWLRPGAVVVADNVGVPGIPEYRAYMKEHEGGIWSTIEHQTHVEYQRLLKDLVLESSYQPAVG